MFHLSLVSTVQKKDLNLITSRLPPIPVNERGFDPTVVKEANKFISFKLRENQLLLINSCLGGATCLDSFVKAYKTSETKSFFPYEKFKHPDKLLNKQLPSYDASHSKLRNCNTVQAKHTDYINLLKRGFTTEQAVVTLKLLKLPLTGIEK